MTLPPQLESIRLSATETPGAEDRWFCRLGPKTMGPIETGHLKKLIEIGRVGPDDVLRLVSQAEWVRFGDVSGYFTETAKYRPPANARKPEGPKPVAAAAPAAPMVYPTASKPVATHVRQTSVWDLPYMRPRPILFTILALIVVGGYVWLYMQFSGRSGPTAQAHYDSLQGIWSEMETLRAKPPTEPEIVAFRADALERVDKIIKNLDQRATADAAHRRHLMWAARENLRPIIDRLPQRPDTGRAQRFQKHMQRVQDLLSGKGGGTPNEG